MSSDENGLGPSSPSDPDGIEGQVSARDSDPSERPNAAGRPVAGPPRSGRDPVPDERLEAVLARIGGGFYDDPETVMQVALRILALERFRLFDD